MSASSFPIKNLVRTSTQTAIHRAPTRSEAQEAAKELGRFIAASKGIQIDDYTVSALDRFRWGIGSGEPVKVTKNAEGGYVLSVPYVDSNGYWPADVQASSLSRALKARGRSREFQAYEFRAYRVGG